MNAHVHLPPNFSAFVRAADAVDQAHEEGLVALGFSNYYDFTVYATAGEACLDRGIIPLLGTEILAMHEPFRRTGKRLNDPVNPGKTYLCGKGIAHLDPIPPPADGMLRRIREADDARMAEIAEALTCLFLEAGLTLDLTVADIRAREADRGDVSEAAVTLQERHLARAFQERLFERVPVPDRTTLLERIFGQPLASSPEDAGAVQAEIRSRLMKVGCPAYAPEPFVGLDEAIGLVVELGGFPAYPVVADGAEPIGEFEATPEILVGNLATLNIQAVEFIPSRNGPRELAAYVETCRRAGLVVTAGTEHNTLGHQPLVPRCRDGQPLPACAEEAFWEGACVVAAHQVRALRGEHGLGSCVLSTLRDEGERILSGGVHG
ncbi:MAG: hypothetical protein KIS66_00390 [Fimbriimonadaceae bacterium]|nr:hypothetical protein [Fimbriimonadaceae bacterium]